jgi:hypothetical protein
MALRGLVTALLAAALPAGACLGAHGDRASRGRPGPPAAAPAATAESATVAAPPARQSAAPAAADFTTRVQPILAARCQPCHFPGGKMHAKLPFDDPATVRTLGERLFTRIKAPEDQAAIRAFLAQP